MKKAPSAFILLVILLFLLHSVAFTQSKWQVGIRIIPQSPSFRYNTPVPLLDFLKTTPYYARWRTAFGIGLNYQLYERWSIASDVVYSPQGGGYRERKTNLDYIKVPLLLGYNASPKRRLIFNIQSGIDFSYLVNAKLKYETGKSINIGDYITKTNLGVPIAAGFKFRIGKSYYLNSQLQLSTDFRTLSKTNTKFKVNNYILPGIRFSIDQNSK